MKNIERLAIEATIYDSSAPLENKNDMLVALRQEGSELAALKTDFDLAEQSIRDLTDACKKQEATITVLCNLLVQLSHERN